MKATLVISRSRVLILTKETFLLVYRKSRKPSIWAVDLIPARHARALMVRLTSRTHVNVIVLTYRVSTPH